MTDRVRGTDVAGETVNRVDREVGIVGMRGGKARALGGMVAVAVAAVALTAGFSSPAFGAFGDGFDVAPVNDGAGPVDEAPAYGDTTEAFWAGACDLASAPAIGEPIPSPGTGVRPATIPVPDGSDTPSTGPAPATPQHCVEWGFPIYSGALWTAGHEPSWRLAAEARAGSHPDGTAVFALRRQGPDGNSGLMDGTVDNIFVDLPPGFVGNPNAVPKCPNEVFAKVPTRCPAESQVGVINLYLSAPPTGGANHGSSNDDLHPIWNLEPRKGRVAELGFAYASNQKAVAVRLVAKVRGGSDNGVTAFVGQIPGALPLIAQGTTLWGVPWEAANDKWRAPEGYPRERPECGAQPGSSTRFYLPWSGFSPVCAQSYDPSWGEIKPFLFQETDCNQSPVTRLWVDQYLDPGLYTAWGEPVPTDDGNWADATSPSPAVQGCESLGFDPDISFAATTTAADAASGLAVDLSIPQNNDALDASGRPLDVPAEDADATEVEGYVRAATDYFASDAGRATAHLKDSVVTLPVGLSVNPSGATGLTACSDAVIGVRAQTSPPLFHTNDPSDGLDGDDCPPSSRIGTVEVDTPVLDETLTGDVILGEPKSTDPQSGGMFRMFLVLRSKERGLLVKVYGSAVADPVTGQLTATFANNPELPFSDLRLDVKGGPRGLLATPRGCGAAGWTSSFTPWSAVGAPTAVADRLDSGALAVNGNCANGFAPALSAGMDNQGGREHGKFAFTFSRPDGDQYLRGLKTTLPQGLLASVRHVDLCTDAQAAAGSCPLGSQIGIVDAKAGAGDPFVLEQKGRVYLTEGYKGGAYGLAVKIRPIAGPFRGNMELSPIIVRQAIHVDPKTAQVTAISDPFPLIHHGVPLRVREVTVLVDRDRFMLNPSDCSEKQIGAAILSDQGATAHVASRFQAAGCGQLRFKPRLKLRLTGRKQTRTGKHPGIRAVVRQKGIREAGIQRAKVTLPKSLALDVNNAQALCEFDQGTKPDLENHCPDGSIVGRARAKTPLLKDDLSGNVYFVKNIRIDEDTGNEIRTLPMIVVALRGEIAVNLIGESSTTRSGRLINTFAGVPDAPVTRFNLNIRGGRNGILAVTRTRRSRINLCTAGRQIAKADMDGQNGRRHDRNIRMKTPCRKRRPSAAKVCRKRTETKQGFRRCVTKVKRNRAQNRRAAKKRKAAKPNA